MRVRLSTQLLRPRFHTQNAQCILESSCLPTSVPLKGTKYPCAFLGIVPRSNTVLEFNLCMGIQPCNLCQIPQLRTHMGHEAENPDLPLVSQSLPPPEMFPTAEEFWHQSSTAHRGPVGSGRFSAQSLSSFSENPTDPGAVLRCHACSPPCPPYCLQSTLHDALGADCYMRIGSLTWADYLQSAWRPFGTAQRGYSKHYVETCALALSHPKFFPVDDRLFDAHHVEGGGCLFDLQTSRCRDARALHFRGSCRTWSTEDGGYLFDLQYTNVDGTTSDIKWLVPRRANTIHGPPTRGTHT